MRRICKDNIHINHIAFLASPVSHTHDMCVLRHRRAEDHRTFVLFCHVQNYSVLDAAGLLVSVSLGLLYVEIYNLVLGLAAFRAF